MRDPPQSDSQLIWKCHNFYNQFLDKVYINDKFIYQMFTRWRFRLATEFDYVLCCLDNGHSTGKLQKKQMISMCGHFSKYYFEEKPFNPGRQYSETTVKKLGILEDEIEF